MFQEHIDSILEGLPPDYHFIIAIIESKFEPLPIEQVEALLAHEARLNKFTKQTQSDSPSINYSQAQHKSSAISSDGYFVPNKTDQESFSAFRGGSGCGGSSPHGRGGVGRRGGGSGCSHCGSRFANFQCQVCFKFVHTTSVCYYHYDQYYQPITTTIHRIVTILVILDLLMFGLIPVTSLPVPIISQILVLCSQMLSPNLIPIIGFLILVLHSMLLENLETFSS